MVNIAGEIWETADRQPEHLAVRTLDSQLTFAELKAASAAAGGYFRQAGVQPYDRVLFIAPTVMEFPITYLGLHALGATVITANTMSTAAELDYLCEDAGVSRIVAYSQCADASGVVAERRDLPLDIIEPGHRYDTEPLTAAHDHDANATALILYTSGTTGRPKGAELTADNLVQTPKMFEPVLQVEPGDRFGTGLPLFHVFGQCVVMNAVLVQGVTLSILHPFTPQTMLRMITEHELTAVSGVPTMWNAILHAAGDYCADDFKHLRVASSGGASLPVEVINAFKTKFGCAILEGYGLTESNGTATFNDIRREQKVGTVGPPLPGAAVEIRDPSGQPVEPGTVGEVFITGPMIFKGYWNRPDATASDLQDGWLRTGDLGSVDADGYLSIVDRVKDLIIRGGYNVYPREVEEVLYAHPEIVEAAVVGIPHEHYGEEVAAVVVRTPGSTLDAEGLRAYAKEQLSAYKVPHVITFTDALPKGPTGKILKRAIDRASLEAQERA